jgi:type I restriction enzyme S subunit
MENNQISKLELIQAQVSFIPDGWKLDKVGKMLVIKNAFRKPISREVRSTIPGCYPYYGPTKIQDYISDYEQDGIYALIGEDGDHFLKYSTMRQTQFISGKCTVNNHAHIIESSDECDSEWFYIFFKHRNITNFLSRQGAGRFKLNKATLEKLPLLVPPLPEQRKIANILKTWDKAISSTERLIDNSKQQKKALMQQLLTGAHKGKRLLDDSSKSFEGEWEDISLESISEIMTDYVANGSFQSLRENVMVTDEIDHSLYVRLTDLRVGLGHKNQKYTSKKSYDFLKKSSLFGGELLMANIGANVGEVWQMPQVSMPATLAPNMLMTKFKSCANSKYVYYYLSSGFGQNRISRVIAGSGHPKINKTELKQVKVLLPSIKEQQKIAAVLTNADKEIELLEQQLADLKQEKKALMQQLLTGKRRVKINDTEAA